MSLAPAPLDDERRLRDIIARRSFKTAGEFTLASGRKSSVYFNMKPTMLYPEGARLIGKLVALHAARLGVDLMGGLEMGAVPLVAAAAAMSAEEHRPVQAIFIRKAAKDHGTMALVEGLADGESLAGKRVLVVEDVTTTGGSSMKAVAVLRQAEAIVTDVLTIVDREEGATKAFADQAISLHALFRKSDFAGDLA
jgi:orotate phosphoribosyltransferase